MTNLDEKKLDELANNRYPDGLYRYSEHYRLVYKEGYKEAFADQQKKIEKLEKAVELMRSGYAELSTAINWYDTKFAGPQHEFEHFCKVEIRGNYIDSTLAEVDELLTEKPSEA